MHFDLSISLGTILTIATLGILIWRVERNWNLYSVEHEMLIGDFCERKGIEVKDLPTRTKRVMSLHGA